MHSYKNNEAYPIFFLSLVLILTLAIHLSLILPIGFISDDYALIQSAKEGKSLWSLHFSPILSWLWQLTAHGSFNPFEWHLLALFFHYVNAVLVYLIAWQLCKLAPQASATAALLYALNPAGMEAIAWCCSLGYVITSTWILLGIYSLSFYSADSPKTAWKYSLGWALLQLIAFLTWDWGILLFPVLFMFALVKTPTKRQNNLLIFCPIATVWLFGLLLRLTSQYQTGWQTNALSTKMMFFFGSPLLGLLSNASKSFFLSPWGMAMDLILLGLLAAAARRSKMALGMVLAYGICILPWVNGGNPSSRYFYIPMVFIYLGLAMAAAQANYRKIAAILINLLLALELIFAYQRAVLWNGAYHQAQKLKTQVEEIAGTSNDPVVIVNLPEAYGPESLPMRPQMWYCGFDTLFPIIETAKTGHCPFLWRNSASDDKQTLASQYPQKSIYEVIDQDGSFFLVPVKK